ncbi:3100_t:CDS:1, partial [Racocetra persica]
LESFSQDDMSITKAQDSAKLGLLICKSLVENNGDQIKQKVNWEEEINFCLCGILNYYHWYLC